MKAKEVQSSKCLREGKRDACQASGGEEGRQLLTDSLPSHLFLKDITFSEDSSV